MALVSISDAAKLVRKARATVARDIEEGRVAKTVLQDGDIRIDTAELVRAYGRLQPAAATGKPAARNAGDRHKITLLEERIRSLERVISLESELRRVKDQVTAELRARLSDKDALIKILENKVLFLEYDKQTQTVPMLTPEPPAAAASKPGGASPAATLHGAEERRRRHKSPAHWLRHWFGASR